MAKTISLRIRRVYYDQIVARTKKVELRAYSKHWRKLLLEGDTPEIAVFVCGVDVHRREITSITVGDPAVILGRPLSEQGKSDVPGKRCFAIWLGMEVIK